MSPISDAFRTRLVMFPSLVNCCTIDWFSNWPGEALESVGRGAVALNANGESLELGKYEASCVEVFKVIHQSVEEITEEYKEAMSCLLYTSDAADE